MKELKLFVGGYYDERVFEGEEFQGKTPFNKDIETYTLSEVLKLGFIEPVQEWFEENYDKEWNEATEEEKIDAILRYTEYDDIAGVLYFNTEAEAEKYKNDTIKEIEEIEENTVYEYKIQDNEGNFREVYKSK